MEPIERPTGGPLNARWRRRYRRKGRRLLLLMVIVAVAWISLAWLVLSPWIGGVH